MEHAQRDDGHALVAKPLVRLGEHPLDQPVSAPRLFEVGLIDVAGDWRDATVVAALKTNPEVARELRRAMLGDPNRVMVTMDYGTSRIPDTQS